MNWIFIVCRNNTVERSKIFKDFWSGASFTDAFILNINPMANTPEYNKGEYYRDDELTVGLYKDSI